MIVATFISFFSFWLLVSHISPRIMRRLVGYKGVVDVVMHGTIIWMFLGTSTDGLLQAEAAGILFSLYLRGYHKLFGYERLVNMRWQRYSGMLTNYTRG